MHLSKGKWIPGMKPKDSVSQYYCDICDRGFVNSSSLQKHLASELHFKRRAENNGRDLRKNDDLFDEASSSRTTTRERRKINNSPAVRIEKNGQQTILCPTCFSRVDKLLMGKHLISHFHCQKVMKKDRKINPERSLILEHIHQIASQSPFQCGPCKYYFTQREQLLQHFEQYHIQQEEKLWSEKNPLNRWSCSSCPEILADDEVEMFNHLTSPGHCKMEAAISKSIPIILRKVSLRSCSFCPKSFILNRELASHIKKIHQNYRTIVIDVLNNVSADVQTSKEKVSADVSEFNETITAKNDVVLEKLTQTCNICNKTFSTVSSLNRHKAQAHHSKLIIHKCTICTYTTNKFSHLQRHSMQHSKPREKLFHCEICSSSFFDICALENHKKIHFKKTVSCRYPGCQYLGRNQSEVVAHALRHKNDKKFVCDQCSYSSKSKFSLTRHVKLNHKKEECERYSCKLCSYSTSLYNCLKRHEFQHKDEKSFHCPHCTFSSRTLENLRIHVVRRKIHSGRFLYNCGSCQNVGSSVKTTFATNSFTDFKYHVTDSHSDGTFIRGDIELLVIAGIKKESENVTNIESSSYGLMLDKNADAKEADVCGQKDLCVQNSDMESQSFIVDSAAAEKCSDIDKYECRNSAADDMFIDEIYDNLLIVSDEELPFADIKDTI